MRLCLSSFQQSGPLLRFSELATNSTVLCLPGKAQQCDRARRLFEQLQQAGFRPNVYSYTSLISACQHVGNWQEAWRVFEAMEQNGACGLLSSSTIALSRLHFLLVKEHILQMEPAVQQAWSRMC